MTATEILAIIGLFTLIAILAGVIVIAEWEIEKLIKNKKREYQVKHRFDKPPSPFMCICGIDKDNMILDFNVDGVIRY